MHGRLYVGIGGKIEARGGAKPQLMNLAASLDVYSTRAPELVALDDALNTPAAVGPCRARIVELGFFGDSVSSLRRGQNYFLLSASFRPTSALLE